MPPEAGIGDRMRPKFERWETPFSDHEADLVSVRSTLMRSLTYPDRHYTFGDPGAPGLEIILFDNRTESLLLVTFNKVDAFRVANGRDLMDHWSDESRAAGTTVKQWGGSWTQEAPLLFRDDGTFRYAIKCDDECIEVVAPYCTPYIRELTADELTITKSPPTRDQIPEPSSDLAMAPLVEGARFIRTKG